MYILEARRRDCPVWMEWTALGYTRTRIAARIKCARYKDINYEVRWRAV